MTNAQNWIAEGPVVLEFANHVATITLNRPEFSNGLNLDVMKALHEAVMRCHREPAVRVVHLRGAGKNFCAGGDVHEFASMGEGLGDFLREVTAWLQMAVGALIRLDAVVVTEVQGFAAGGGGLGLVCASDIVIAGESAKFLAGATRVGMAPDGGGSVILTQLVGFRRAMDIVLTNRIVDAAEAERIGLITGVCQMRTCPPKLPPPPSISPRGHRWHNRRLSGCCGTASMSSALSQKRRGQFLPCRRPPTVARGSQR